MFESFHPSNSLGELQHENHCAAQPSQPQSRGCSPSPLMCMKDQTWHGACSRSTHRLCLGTACRSGCLQILEHVWFGFKSFFLLLLFFHSFLFHFLPAPQEAMVIDMPHCCSHGSHCLLRSSHPTQSPLHICGGACDVQVAAPSAAGCLPHWCPASPCHCLAKHVQNSFLL